MRQRMFWVLSLTLCLAFALPAWAQKGKSTTQGDIPACATFRDGATDLVVSDGFGGGLPYCDAVDGVRVVIGNTRGAFNMDTGNSFRRVGVNFPNCSRLITPDADGNCLTAVVIATMNEQEQTGVGFISTGEKLNLLQMEVGSTRYADFRIAFPSRSKSTPHVVIFGGSNLGADAWGEPLSVTRADADTWTIEAADELACLLEVVSKNNNREITQRDFTLPFMITITRQP